MASVYEQMRSLRIQPTTKQQIIRIFKDRYPGSKVDKRGNRIEAWRGKLADAVTPYVSGEKRDSIMRQFQGKRSEAQKVNPKWQQAYRELGETLPPQIPEGGFKITGTVWVAYSPGSCEPRSIGDPPIHISYKTALHMLGMEADKVDQAVVNAYQADQEEADIDFDGPDVCKPPELIVTAA